MIVLLFLDLLVEFNFIVKDKVLINMFYKCWVGFIWGYDTKL
jgi:hypothetical protein